MTRLNDYLLLAAAGGVGTVLRAACTTIAVRLAGPESSWAAQSATLAMNVVGSFLFGLVYAVGGPKLGLSAAWQSILLAGLLGGFTTYSSFAFQAVEMAGHGRLPAAVAYVAATNLLALAAVWAGLRLAAV